MKFKGKSQFAAVKAQRFVVRILDKIDNGA
jgi:hypothetical protein